MQKLIFGFLKHVNVRGYCYTGTQDLLKCDTRCIHAGRLNIELPILTDLLDIIVHGIKV